MTGKKARSVKHWPEGERPRERLTAHGPATLANAQLLAIIIKIAKLDAPTWTLPWFSS